MVVSDLHGNLRDYEKYTQLWDGENPENHLLITGDLIHGDRYVDKSIEILDDAIAKFESYDNFHLLCGNHECCHILNKTIVKHGINLNKKFENLIDLYENSPDLQINHSLDDYIDFFKKMGIIAKTENGIFISHAGPPTEIKTENIEKLINHGDYDSLEIRGFLWNRYYSVTNNDIDNFLNLANSKFMVVGHTPVEGVKINKKQLILASSYGTSKKAYLNIELSSNIETITDLEKTVKYIN